jgi:hypothetical protein
MKMDKVQLVLHRRIPQPGPRPMATKGEQFAGLTVALVTPFKNGEVDYAALG